MLDYATTVFKAYKDAYDNAADNDAKLAAYNNKPYISIALSTKDDIKIRGTEKGDAITGEYTKTLNFEDVAASEVTNDTQFYTSDVIWSGALKGTSIDQNAKNSRYNDKTIHSSSTRNEGGVKISKKNGISGNYLLVQSDYSNSITTAFYNMFPEYSSEYGDRIYQISFDTKIFDDTEREENLSAKERLLVSIGGEFGTKGFAYKYNTGDSSTTDAWYTLVEANPNNIKNVSYNEFAGFNGMNMSEWNTYVFSNVTTQLNNYGALVMTLPRMENASTHGLGFDNIKVCEITHEPKLRFNNPSKWNKTGPSAACQNRDQYLAPVAAQVLDFTTVNTGNNVYLYKLPLDYVNAVDADENERKLSVKFDFKTTAGSNGIVAAYKTDWDGGTAPSNLESQITKANRLGAVAVNPSSDNKYGSYSIDITEYARAAVEEYNNSFSASNAKERPYVSVIITTTDNVKLITSAKADETAWAKTLDFNNQTAAAATVKDLNNNLNTVYEKGMSTGVESGDSIYNTEYDLYTSINGTYSGAKKGPYLVGDSKENSLYVAAMGSSNYMFFYNLFGDKNSGVRDMTSEDIGRVFDISFDIAHPENIITASIPMLVGIGSAKVDLDSKKPSFVFNNAKGEYSNKYYILKDSTKGTDNTVTSDMKKYNGFDPDDMYGYGDTIKTSWEVTGADEQGFLRITLPGVNATYSMGGGGNYQLDNIVVKEITDAPKVEFRNPSENISDYAGRRQYHAVAAEAKVLIGEINDDMDDMLVCTAVADNSGSTQESVVRAMIAFYSGDELVTVKLSAPVTVGAGESKNVSMIVSKDSVSGYTEAKGFVWDMNTLKPYTDKQNLQ